MNKYNIYINFIFILLILLFLELLSKYIDIIFPYESHQKYGYTKSSKILNNKFYKLNVNGRGAIGELFSGQKIQIAFFGNSSLFDGVPMDKNWPSLLRQLNNKNIHIDNFAFFGQKIEELNEKLKSLCNLKRFYDISVIQLSNFNYEDIVLRYHDRRKPNSKKYQTYQQIKKWYNRNKKFNQYFKKPPDYLTIYLEHIIELKNFHKQQSHLFIKDKSKKVPINDYNAPYRIEQIIDSVKCISNRIFWLTEPFAYSKNMLTHYKNIPLSFYYRLENNQSSEYIFLDLEFQAHYTFKQQKIIKDILKKHNKELVFIDIANLIQKELSKKENLFIDETHLSEKGHELVFNLMLPYFKSSVF